MAKAIKKKPESTVSDLSLPPIVSPDRKPAKPEKIVRKLVNFKFPPHLIENLRREAWHKRKTNSEVLFKILENYYKENPQEPIPTQDDE